MFYSNAIPAILPAWTEEVTTGEVSACPATRGEPGRQQQNPVFIQTRERTHASMTAKQPQHTQGPGPSPYGPSMTPADSVQPLDLVMLYEKFKRPIHSYIYRLLGSQEDADDLTQEVFMRAFMSWNDLYDRENLSPWLYRIATNLCVDLLRRRKRIAWWPLSRQGRADDQAEGGVADEENSYLPSNQGGIPEVFEREHIRLALASMPEDYAIVLVLSAAQGVPYQEIAVIIGISPNAAATRISRAKRMFAEQYQRLSAEGVDKQERQR